MRNLPKVGRITQIVLKGLTRARSGLFQLYRPVDLNGTVTGDGNNITISQVYRRYSIRVT